MAHVAIWTAKQGSKQGYFLSEKLLLVQKGDHFTIFGLEFLRASLEPNNLLLNLIPHEGTSTFNVLVSP